MALRLRSLMRSSRTQEVTKLLALCWRSGAPLLRFCTSPASATLPGFALDDLPRRVPSAYDDTPDKVATSDQQGSRLDSLRSRRRMCCTRSELSCGSPSVQSIGDGFEKLAELDPPGHQIDGAERGVFLG